MKRLVASMGQGSLKNFRYHVHRPQVSGLLLVLDYYTAPHVKEYQHGTPIFWVAVKELKLSYYIGETLLFTIYTHYGNLI